jgi:hypothetical protein
MQLRRRSDKTRLRQICADFKRHTSNGAHRCVVRSKRPHCFSERKSILAQHDDRRTSTRGLFKRLQDNRKPGFPVIRELGTSRARHINDQGVERLRAETSELEAPDQRLQFGDRRETKDRERGLKRITDGGDVAF